MPDVGGCRKAAAVGIVSLHHIGHSMGTTDFIDLNFGYAAGAAIRISRKGGSCSALCGAVDNVAIGVGFRWDRSSRGTKPGLIEVAERALTLLKSRLDLISVFDKLNANGFMVKLCWINKNYGCLAIHAINR